MSLVQDCVYEVVGKVRESSVKRDQDGVGSTQLFY